MSPKTTPSATRDSGSDLDPRDTPRDFMDANDCQPRRTNLKRPAPVPPDFGRKVRPGVASEAHPEAAHYRR
jgi:hypothetical protein